MQNLNGIYKKQIQDIVGQINRLSNTKLDEALGVIRREVDNALDELDRIILEGKPQLAAEGVGNVNPRLIEADGVKHNEPLYSMGNSDGFSSIPSPPSSMSDNLVNVRSTIKDPRAVEAFDSMFGKMRGNSANMERAIEGIRKKGTDLEESMLAKWEKANRTAFGVAVDQIPDALARGQELRNEVQAFKDANPQIKGINEWFRRINAELKNLNQMQRGMKEAIPEEVQGYLNNFNGVEAEFRYAQKQPGVIGVGQKMPLDGLPKKVDVDVVADNGKTWIDNKNVKPFSLESSTWKGEIKDNVEKGGLKKQVERQLRAAQQNPVDGVPPKVVIEFPQGVSREVAEELQRMGVEVRGTIAERQVEQASLSSQFLDSPPTPTQNTSLLTDTQLVEAIRQVQTWRNHKPIQPDVQLIKELGASIGQLQQEKKQLINEILTQKQLLQQIEPRSLFNPFGTPKSTYENQLRDLELKHKQLQITTQRLENTTAQFEKWQPIIEKYSAWRNHESRQLESLLSSPTYQPRVEVIHSGYETYGAAKYILDNLGQTNPSNQFRHFQGQTYRIEQSGTTINIFHKDISEPIYTATDNREAGGIINIHQFNLKQTDKKIIVDYAQDLEAQKQQQQQPERDF